MLDFRNQIQVIADYLINKRNPYDGGWGLHIEKMMQTSSIVNTTEAIFVIRCADMEIDDIERTISFLKESIRDHPNTRGDNLRYFVFGLLGLLEAGMDVNDPFMTSIAESIEKRIINDIGWGEHSEDKEPRMWQTFLSLWALERVFGKSYVMKKYRKSLTNILSIGQANNYLWGFQLKQQSSVSLGATALALIILSIFYPDEPGVFQAHYNVVEKLNNAFDVGSLVEVEPISGTDWNHYSYSWAIRALHISPILLDESTFFVTVKGLRLIQSLFNGRCYREPNKEDCNVRSAYNNVMALDAIIKGFNPQTYLFFDDILRNQV